MLLFKSANRNPNLFMNMKSIVEMHIIDKCTTWLLLQIIFLALILIFTWKMQYVNKF